MGEPKHSARAKETGRDKGNLMAKRGTKEPEGSEIMSCSVTDKMNRSNRGEPGHVPCWWSKHGHTDPSFGTRPVGATKKYAEGYERIRWDNERTEE
jgi:hypothetical protein